MVTGAMAGDSSLLENLQGEERRPGLEPRLMLVLKGWTAIKDTEPENERAWRVNQHQKLLTQKPQQERVSKRKEWSAQVFERPGKVGLPRVHRIWSLEVSHW